MGILEKKLGLSRDELAQVFEKAQRRIEEEQEADQPGLFTKMLGRLDPSTGTPESVAINAPGAFTRTLARQGASAVRFADRKRLPTIPTDEMIKYAPGREGDDVDLAFRRQAQMNPETSMTTGIAGRTAKRFQDWVFEKTDTGFARKAPSQWHVWFGEDLVGGATSMAATMGALVAGGPAAAMYVGGAAEAMSVYDEAKARGASERGARVAADLNYLVSGALETIGAQFVFKGLTKALNASEATRKVIPEFVDRLLGGGMEGATEFVQSLGASALVNAVAEEDKSIGEAMTEALREGGAGGVAGFIFQAFSAAIGAKQAARARKAQAVVEAEIELDVTDTPDPVIEEQQETGESLKPFTPDKKSFTTREGVEQLLAARRQDNLSNEGLSQLVDKAFQPKKSTPNLSRNELAKAFDMTPEQFTEEFGVQLNQKERNRFRRILKKVRDNKQAENQFAEPVSETTSVNPDERDASIKGDDKAAEIQEMGSPVVPAKPIMLQPVGGDQGTTPVPTALPLRTKAPKGITRMTDAPEVIDALGNVLRSAGMDVPMRQGRLAKMYAGVWKVFPEVIRTRHANDIAVTAHEIGHGLERAMFGLPGEQGLEKATNERALARELVGLGRALYGDKIPNGGYRREGFADFVKLYVTSPEEAQSSAPAVYRWFEQKLSQKPETLRALQKARELYQAYDEQGSVSRAKASIVYPNRVVETIGRAKDYVKGAFTFSSQVDVLNPLFIMDKAVLEVDPEYDLAKLPGFSADALRGRASAVLQEFVRGGGPQDIAGNNKGLQNLDTIMAPVRGMREDFTTFLVAQRTLALATPTAMHPNGRETGMLVPDANEFIEAMKDEGKFATFSRAASMLYQWQDAVLDYVAQSSPTMRATVEAIREADPGFYIPLQREFRAIDEVYNRARASGSSVTRGQIAKALRGSRRRQIDPMRQIIIDTSNKIHAAHRRMVLDRVISASESVSGLGKFVEQVDDNFSPVMTRSIEDVIKTLEREAEVAIDTSNLSDDSMKHLVTFFAPAKFKDDSRTVPVVFKDPETGESMVKGFQMQPEIMDIFASMRPEEAMMADGTLRGLSRISSAVKRFSAYTTTTIRPAFAAVNVIRDIPTWWIQSQSSANSFVMAMTYLESVYDVVTGTVGPLVGHKNAWFEFYNRLGIQMSTLMAQSRTSVNRETRRMFEGRITRVADPRNWWEFIAAAVQMGESFGRMAELKLIYKEMNIKPGQTLTLEQMMRLRNAGARATVDFAAMGSLGRIINMHAAFYNAGVQGLRAQARAFKKNPAKVVMMRGLPLLATTIAYWLMNREREEYRQLDPRDKFLNFYYFHSDGTVIKVPRGFGLIHLFTSVPEMLLDGAFRRGKDWNNLGETFGKNFLDTVGAVWDANFPNPIPTILDETKEQLSNWDSYFERPIVSQAMQGKPPEQQFDEFTSLAAIELGNLFKVSPKRIDHAMRNFPAAFDVLSAAGVGPKDLGMPFEKADIPVAGRFFVRGGKFGSMPRDVDELYDLYDEMILKSNDEFDPETPLEKERRLMVSDALRSIGNIGILRSEIKDSTKRRELRKVQMKIAKSAWRVLRVKGLSIRSPFKTTRKTTEPARKAIQQQRKQRRRQRAN